MDGEDGSVGNPDKEDYESSTHSTPQEHRSFAEFAKDKLDSAGRELRRRLPMAGQLGAHLMHPRRLLLHSTPTQHTDVVLIFPKGLPDSMLLWLLQKLRGSRPRLRVCVRQHASSQCSAFYITADDDVLLQTAEEMHLPKQLKPEFGGGYKEFTVRDMHCFQKGSSAAELLNSQERGALVKHALESARAEPGDEHALEPALTLRPFKSECTSQDDVRPSARNTPRTVTPTTPKQPANDKAAADKKKLFIGKIPFSSQEATPGAPLSLLGVRGLRDEPLHRSAHCIPHPTQHRPLVNPTLQELSGSVSAGGSEPDLNAVPSSAPSIDASATSSEDDKPKDKGSRSRAKAALVKRVRSVAVFSLGLRRAREAAAHAHDARSPVNTPSLPAPMLGGELSLIPIEQLIQVDDVKPRTT